MHYWEGRPGAHQETAHAAVQQVRDRRLARFRVRPEGRLAKRLRRRQADLSYTASQALAVALLASSSVQSR